MARESYAWFVRMVFHGLVGKGKEEKIGVRIKEKGDKEI